MRDPRHSELCRRGLEPPPHVRGLPPKATRVDRQIRCSSQHPPKAVRGAARPRADRPACEAGRYSEASCRFPRKGEQLALKNAVAERLSSNPSLCKDDAEERAALQDPERSVEVVGVVANARNLKTPLSRLIEVSGSIG